MRFHQLFFVIHFLVNLSPLIAHSQSLKKFEFSTFKMGTTFRLVFYAKDSSQANLVAKKAFRRIDDLNEKLSDYHNESELNKLSQSSGTNTFVPVSDDLWKVIIVSLEASKKSKGAFDITAGRYVKLWRRAKRKNELPSAKELEDAKKAVGYDKIVLDQKSQSVKLIASKMKLDLGGIAKGYTLDEILKVLRGEGINSALIDGGGDILLGDAPPEANGWKINIAKDSSSTLNKTLVLSNISIASSGDLYNFVEINDVRYSHIVNPKTGLGLTNQITSTIIAKDGISADYLASTLCILGIKDGLKLANKHDFPAIIQVKQGNNTIICQSKRFKKLIN
ncbi:FAD:protein FMN transferase [Flexithrix dorotheae]|uniref:FAD:protein FMN transferase n=1 Tax=Flexithrix dorotheae TaxID=70993 RepID=UPI000379794B|nr:FAD:protein FMN transferase [Flexithrix dorotheae]